MKTCFRCNIEKNETDFHKNLALKGGRFNKCKDCAASDQKERLARLKLDKNWMEKNRSRVRKYYATIGVIKKVSPKEKKEINKRYSNKFPEKIMARSSCQKIKPPTVGLEKHHWNYNDEHFKDVLWLSKKDHMKAHRFLVYDQERKMYRRYDTNELLDTKERHEKFIFKCVRTKPD